MIKFLPWELAFLGQMKKGKKTCKQILHRPASEISSGSGLLLGLPFEGDTRAYVSELTSVFVSLSAASLHLYICTHHHFSLCMSYAVN